MSRTRRKAAGLYRKISQIAMPHWLALTDDEQSAANIDHELGKPAIGPNRLEEVTGLRRCQAPRGNEAERRQLLSPSSLATNGSPESWLLEAHGTWQHGGEERSPIPGTLDDRPPRRCPIEHHVQTSSLIPSAGARATYTVSVKELCAFTAKSGDLDRRFTPSPTAQEGIAGHKAVAAKRPASHLSEVSLRGTFEGLVVRGRADGYDPDKPRLEEVKTHRGQFERIPENHRRLHLAQAETYAHLKSQQDGLPGLEVAVLYLEIDTRSETSLGRYREAHELEALFVDRCRRFSAWAASEIAHRTARDHALLEMKFVHNEFRSGQRDLAEAVYRGAREGKCVLAEAPTGIGKTIGTLFPALKALAVESLDKVFFLTAKNSGKQAAMHALACLNSGSIAPPRVIELVARESACVHPGSECHGDSCPLARGFYDRLATARTAAMTTPMLDRERVQLLAREHDLCPYYLGQELVKWMDVVIADYNHWFDETAALHAMTLTNEWRVVVLVDEAHNLVERGRSMYTTELTRSDLQAAIRAAPSAARPTLKALDRAWKALLDAQADDYQVHDVIPARFLDRLNRSVALIGVFQAEDPAAIGPELLQTFFALTAFARLAEAFGEHSICDATLVRADDGRPDHRLCVRNVSPGHFLAPRFSTARSVILFSATLAPRPFYRSMLSLPESAVDIEVESAFTASQLQVRIASHISTRYGDRARSIAPITELIVASCADAPGNYIAFFSSFDYMEQVVAEVAKHPIKTWQQLRRTSLADEKVFLDRFVDGGRGVGFAVLGGRFAEGIDLPGNRLIGAFIATLGLPQVNAVNEQMRRRLQKQFGQGFDFAYLYPGLTKIAQAAGRVIRDESDRGSVHLIDDRFDQAKVRSLLPRWWGI